MITTLMHALAAWHCPFMVDEGHSWSAPQLATKCDTVPGNGTSCYMPFFHLTNLVPGKTLSGLAHSISRGDRCLVQETTIAHTLSERFCVSSASSESGFVHTQSNARLDEALIRRLGFVYSPSLPSCRKCFTVYNTYPIRLAPRRVGPHPLASRWTKRFSNDPCDAQRGAATGVN